MSVRDIVEEEQRQRAASQEQAALLGDFSAVSPSIGSMQRCAHTCLSSCLRQSPVLECPAHTQLNETLRPPFGCVTYLYEHLAIQLRHLMQRAEPETLGYGHVQPRGQ